ncbi:MAG: glycosyltransferase [Rhodobacteraceae bacterium]|nr:glycosyltransferase [Paracoccaceae bacterium]
MKIAYILNTYPQPSHSFIRREIRALEAQGLSVHRMAMRSADGDLPDPQDRAEADRTEYVLAAGALGLLVALLTWIVKSPAGFLRGFGLAIQLSRGARGGVLRHLIYLAEAAYVANRCRDLQIDHCHAHFGTNSTSVAILAHALGGPSYSFTTHGPEEFDAPGALSLGMKLDRAAFAVGVSQFGRSQLCRWASFESWPKLHVVHCGIEPEKFAHPLPIPKSPCHLVSIGRFVEQKGQMVLVQAMTQLRDSHPDLHLSLIGDGEMRPDLERAIQEAGLQDRITLTGWLTEAQVLEQLNRANGLVMPSFAEGLPMVVMEAMAAARPVIATYIAGTPELVKQGETGWLVPAGDAGALADAMAELAATPADRLQQMGQAGRVRVLERHDTAKEARKLARLFATSGVADP